MIDSYSMDARTPNIVKMPSKYASTIPFLRAALIECRYERQCVRTPFPPLFICLCLVLYSVPTLRSMCCCSIVQSTASNFSSLPACALGILHITPDGNKCRTRQMMRKWIDRKITPEACHHFLSRSCFNSRNGYNAQGESHDRKHHATRMWNAKCSPV